MGLKQMVIDLSPLRSSREFRYIFIARTISLFGIGFLAVALPLQVFRLTGSTLGVASVSAVLAVSVFVGTIGGGVLADRHDRRRLIIAARAIAGIGFAVLAANALLPEPQMWIIYVCAAVDGLCGGLSATALVSVTPSLVPREKLAAAAALMTLTTELGAVVAPALGGVLAAGFGVQANFGIAAVATAATTYCITRLPPLPPTVTRRETLGRALATGARFAVQNRVVGGVLLAGVLAMLLAGVTVLLPEFVERVLHGGPATLGVLHSATAIGAVLGSLTSGWTGRVRGAGTIVLLAVLLAAGGLLGAGLAGVTALTLLGLIAHGLGRAIGDILRFAVIQQHTPDELRGRVASLWQAQMSVGLALGTMVAGLVATVVPVRWAIAAYGGLGVVGAVVLLCTLRGLRAARLDVAEPAAVPAAGGAGRPAA